jgi:hypothetical protein
MIDVGRETALPFVSIHEENVFVRSAAAAAQIRYVQPT